MLKVFFCDISKFSEEDFIKLYSSISKNRQKKADRLKNDNAKKLSVAAGALCRKVIAEHFNLEPSEVNIKNKRNGKPFADGLDIHFSISHSAQMAICAISDVPVGVDIEKIRSAPSSVVERCFTEDEKAYLDSKEKDRDKRFFEIWTKKEAYVKMTGRGIKDFSELNIIKRFGICAKEYNGYMISVARENKNVYEFEITKKRL